MQRLISYLLLLVLATSLGACGGSGNDSSDDAASQQSASASAAADIGPVQKVDLGPIEEELAEQGEEIFNTRCKTCHRFGERYVGPDLTNTAGQRDPVYIMNMILAPEKMLQNHPTAKALMAEYGTMMTNQNLSREQARALLEYLREVNQESEESETSSQ